MSSRFRSNRGSRDSRDRDRSRSPPLRSRRSGTRSRSQDSGESEADRDRDRSWKRNNNRRRQVHQDSPPVRRRIQITTSHGRLLNEKVKTPVVVNKDVIEKLLQSDLCLMLCINDQWCYLSFMYECRKFFHASFGFVSIDSILSSNSFTHEMLSFSR